MHRLRTLTAVSATLVSVAGLAGGALAATLVPPAVPHPVAVGPVSGENGFPVSYTDSSGVRLEGCLDGGDPMCALTPVDGFDPTVATSFPDNFPDEFFYQLASASITTGNGGKATLTEGLEGAFANGAVKDGDQMVFGRFRLRITNAVPNAKYTVIHPYGEDVLTADGTGVVSVTEDIGLTAGEFTGALGSRIGPFLKWDTGAPAGYIGDPNVDHAITGSPYVDDAGNPQNYFKIDGPGIGGAGIDTVSTDKFSLLGKLASNNGVDNTSATYTRNADGTKTLDVYATSAPDQALDVSGTGFDRTTMLGEGGRYFAHIDFTGAPPTSVKVTNSGHKPAAVKTTPVVDAVNISSAVYDTASNSLTVKASSSDAATPPTLAVAGFGPMTAATTVFDNVIAPPATITVDSSAGGSDSDTVTGTGPGLAPIAVQAFAGADTTVQQGQNVTLDGSESTGEVTSYAWTQVAGTPVTLTGGDTAKPTFTAPGTSGPLSFTLTVTGPGGPSSDTVDLTVADVVAPVAAAGPDQTVVRGAKVTLNGTASTGATSYQWIQVQATGDPAVTLTGANTATPSFSFPASDKPLTFQLTVTGPGGSSTDSVSVAPKSDALTATARYRTGGREWIISGTATLLSPANTVTVHNGPTLSGAVIGSPAPVDAVDGTWRVRLKPSAVAPDATRTISIESKLGGVRLAIPVNVTS